VLIFGLFPMASLSYNVLIVLKGRSNGRPTEVFSRRIWSTTRSAKDWI